MAGKLDFALLSSNKSINNVYNFLTKGFRDSYNSLGKTIDTVALKGEGFNTISQKKMGVLDAIKEGHKAEANDINVGGYSVNKIAGSYIGLSAAGRIATGGGLYKDKNGNTDIIGIPFI